MQQETVVPPTSKIAELENWLVMKPADLKSIRQLVTRLEHTPKAPGSAGRFSAAQADIVTSLGADWQAELFEPEHMVKQYRAWLAALRSRGVSQAVPIGQVFSGRVLKVRGQNAYCGVFLDFFKETGAIPALCNDCYKVQILPHDLRAMFQTYALLLKLDLPNDNARKCMIELRDGIKFPYKAYIYCDTVDDVRACLHAFRDLQAKHGIEGISSKISHGCSEYGQKYPAFKFPETDDAPEFVPDPQWPAIEKAYFRSIKLPAQARDSNTREHVSLRDVFAFCTWVKYADLIGDPTSEAYAALRGPDLPQQFIKRVRSQAKIRRREMEELQKTE
ncbi:hypothetical protein [Ruegeria arenilitoris]|uniref:hypothetical protein n=1 Tax=Ruegeria arenilitoris TaxID=1173585 RepID=UPI00147B8E7D|nr:hypothetical protein [Ruegeria arenilitoris]